MKTTIALIIVAIVGMCTFTGCSAIASTIGAIGSVVLESPDLDLEKKKSLERLMNEHKHVLLSEDEKVRAAKNICSLKHLNRNIKNDIFLEEAKIFCKLEENDKIYFYDKCMECGNSIDTIATSYLLVRDEEPIEMVEIERKYSEELGRTIPIVERLH